MPKRQSRSNDRRRDILQAALRAFTEHGLSATTVEMICEGSGASVGSVYHHFGNKIGVATALYQQGLEEHFDALHARATAAEDARGVIAALIESFIDWTTENPDWARFIFAVRADMMQSEAAEKLTAANKERVKALRDLLAPHVEQGHIRQLPFELYQPLIHGPVLTYVRAWLAGRTASAPTEHRETFVQAAWRAVGNE
ncbi:hypothetical protein CAI21_19685 [Alkalilimnicola ehrlichii]|uniref:HTH tetR-type domain-containing protein n=1 Tax=Alkalilimnicola ehrlichii TaxID=351052 RepID=A0A3E0WH33_9GAMM|nr:TetR/AcrR family transcriptional regulator [Alkalilimnicola ehrlichii]RFA25194.1 hypothetical protein CAI21_19685 [Alkalilimnicola ehrlichii]RFA32272.1 hypothetical protein CAL65_20105 [Alkalilimnicola ehrlichii]